MFIQIYVLNFRGIQPSIEQIAPLLPKYDLSPDTQANGYRSLLKVVHKCCTNLLRLSRYINVNRSSLFFRGNFYSKELEAYVICLGQLRATLHYAQKLVAYSQDGSLFADEDNLNDPVVENLMEEVESLSQNCFYGRCFGFQVCQTVHFMIFFSTLSLKADIGYKSIDKIAHFCFGHRISCSLHIKFLSSSFE